MLKELVRDYGKDKVNTLTKYPSILTLHKLGERGRLLDELTTPIEGEKMYATEKIDGTNTRILIWGDEYIVGARENLLHYKGDLFFDPSQGIVDTLKQFELSNWQMPIWTPNLTVIYGEVYGGRVTGNSKWYGQDKTAFRVFDVVQLDDVDEILQMPIEKISLWREYETPRGMVYGQKFMTVQEMKWFCRGLELVPEVEFDLGDMQHQTILDNLKKSVPETKAALSPKALKKTEGVVLRNQDRTKIVKVRFEDYERTLK
jgi:hypothetical protein